LNSKIPILLGWALVVSATAPECEKAAKEDITNKVDKNCFFVKRAFMMK